MNQPTFSVEGDREQREGVGTAAAAAPLVFHIRRRRQWHAEHGLSQAELAELTGLSLRHIRRYETCRALPRVLDALLTIAIALQVPLETLIDPRQVERLSQIVEE